MLFTIVLVISVAYLIVYLMGWLAMLWLVLQVKYLERQQRKRMEKRMSWIQSRMKLKTFRRAQWIKPSK